MRKHSRALCSCGRFSKRTILALLIAFALVPTARAQSGSDYVLQTGRPAFTSADTLPQGLGFVNVANGNVHIEIPLGSYPQRGSGGPFSARLIYDSRQWQLQPSFNPPWAFRDVLGGWAVVTNVDSGFFDSGLSVNSCAGGDTAYYDVFSWRAPDRTYHFFSIRLVADHSCGATNVLSGDAYALDGSGLRMFATVTPGSSVLNDTLTVTVYTPNGTRIVPPYWSGNFQVNGTVEDSNGNFWQGNTFSHAVPSDTLGRQPLTMTFPPNPQYYTPPTSYNLLDSKNTVATLSATWALIHVHTNFGVPGYQEADHFIQPLKSLTLPDGTSYQFTYDCDSSTGESACGSPAGQAGYYGLLTSIRVPTGGVINLTYTNFTDANGNVNRWVTSVSYGGGTWTYAPATGCGTSCQTVTVTRPSGDQAVNTFVLNMGNGAWNTSVQYFNGAATGTPVTTVQTLYDSFPTHPLLGSFAFTHPTSTTVTVAGPGGNLVKKTTYTYDSMSYPYQGQVYTGSLGKLLTRGEHGFGSGTPGNLLRKSVFAYLDDADPAYRTKNILDRIRNVQVQDAGGSPQAETKITYDSTTLTSVAGVASHDDANYGLGNTIRGNPTLTERWVAGTNYLPTTMHYDTTGQVVRVTDPKGNQTNLSYTDNYLIDAAPVQNPPQTFTPPLPTNAFPTQITLPGIGSASLGYYYGSSKLAFSRDQNGADAYQHYLDSLDRVTHTYFPLTNGNRAWTLVSHASATVVDTYMTVNDAQPSTSCASCRHEQTTLDGLGRVITNALVNDPQGSDFVQTTYDTSGRMQSASNPYRSTADPTYGLRTFTYDGLNQTTSVTHPDGSVAQTFYGAAVPGGGGLSMQQGSTAIYGLGYPVLSKDEAGKVKQIWIDALGRVVEVDEPGPGPGSAATPGAGWIDITGAEQSTIDSVEVCDWVWDPYLGEYVWQCWWEYTTIWDSGGVSINVNGQVKSVSYGYGSTGASLASALASAINADSSYPVTASAAGNRVNLVSKATGTASNYPLSTTSSTNDPAHFSSPSFVPLSSGASLTGGSDATPPGTLSLSAPSVTLYKYTLLDNLTDVVQGSQTRTYSYDGLSRLTSTTAPESGQTTFQYTTAGGTLCSGNSNDICRKIDARGILTTNTYNDPLSRLTQVSYGDGTPTVTFTYDQGGAAANALGRLTSVTDGSGSTSYTYDASGRITQTIVGSGFSIGYQYNLAGQTTTITYPSGRQVTQQLDAIGRLSAIQSGTTNYVSLNGPNQGYNAAGFPVSLSYGNGVNATIGYNNRLQFTSLNYTKQGQTQPLFDLRYWYYQDSTNCPTGATANNGQIQCIGDLVDSTRSVSYLYDALHRLKQAEIVGSATSKWILEWTYDQYGNRLSQTLKPGSVGPHPTNEVTVGAATNRITGTGYAYDASGNMTADGLNTLMYDAENLVKTVNIQPFGLKGWTGTRYKYDARGRRVSKEERWACGLGGVNIRSTTYVYSGSSLLYEYVLNNPCAGQGTTSTKEYIYSGDQLVAYHYQFLSTNTLTYVASDHLSARLLTDTNGSVVTQHGHYPFGENWYGGNYQWKFTTYERDAESGNDYAIARYHANRLGRFLAADPVDGYPVNPQSWNAFAYVQNDPVNAVDPLGLDPIFGLVLQYWSPGSSVGYWGGFGSFGGGGFGGVGGFGGGSGGAISALLWTPSGYNPCAFGCGTPSYPPAFSSPSPILEGAAASANYLWEEAKGVWSVTGGAVLNALQHPVDTAMGSMELMMALDDPYEHMDYWMQMTQEAKAWGARLASGDPRAMGQLFGTVFGLKGVASGTKVASTGKFSAFRYKPFPAGAGPGFSAEVGMPSGGFFRADMHTLHFGKRKIPVGGVPHADMSFSLFGRRIVLKHFPWGPWTTR